MQSHFLKLNEDKTELLLVHSKYRQMPHLLLLVVGNEMIMPTECARNIGVMFDHNLTKIPSVCNLHFFTQVTLGKSGNTYLNMLLKSLSTH